MASHTFCFSSTDKKHWRESQIINKHNSCLNTKPAIDWDTISTTIKKARTLNWLKLASFSYILFFPHSPINKPIFSADLYNTDTREGSQRGYLWYFNNYKSNSLNCSLKWFDFWNTVYFSTYHTTPVQSMSIVNNKYGSYKLLSVLYSASNVFLIIILMCFISISISTDSNGWTKKQIQTILPHFLKQEITRLNNKCRNLETLRLEP